MTLWQLTQIGTGIAFILLGVLKLRDRLASHSTESEFSDECDQAIDRLQFRKGWSASRKVQDDRVATLEAKLAKAVEQRNALYDLLQENSFGVYSADEAAQDIASDDVELLTVGSVVESERANASKRKLEDK